MAWYSILAIYLLFWTVTLFVVLPYGIRSNDEVGGELVPGQEVGAPHHVSLWKKALWTTIISTIFFVLFYLNWEMDWIERSDIERLFDVIYR